MDTVFQVLSREGRSIKGFSSTKSETSFISLSALKSASLQMNRSALEYGFASSYLYLATVKLSWQPDILSTTFWSGYYRI